MVVTQHGGGARRGIVGEHWDNLGQKYSTEGKFTILLFIRIAFKVLLNCPD